MSNNPTVACKIRNSPFSITKVHQRSCANPMLSHLLGLARGVFDFAASQELPEPTDINVSIAIGK